MYSDPSGYFVALGDIDTSEQKAVDAWVRCRVDLPGSANLYRSKYRWMYVSNPAGPALIAFLGRESDPEPIGLATVAARTFISEQEEVSAGLLIDFAVSPKHRTLSPGLLLQRSAQQAALESKAFVYGIPDKRALPLFRRLKSTLVLDIPRFVRVVRSFQYLSRTLPTWIAGPAATAIDLLDRVYCATTLARNGPVTEWVDSFDSRFDELWRQVDTTRLVIGQRTSKFLTWRFPRSGKRTLVFVARQSGGAAIHTYFVGEVESSVFVVKDFLTIASGTRLDKTMHAFIRATRQLGVSAISISMLPTPTVKDAFVRARFVARDSRSCFFTLSQGSPEALATASWHLTAADEDM